MINDININDLLSRFLAGEALPEEAMILEDWMKSSPANQLIYYNAVRIFGSPGIPDENEAKLKAWEKIRSAIVHDTRKLKLTRAWMAVAASVALLVTVVALTRYYFNKPPSSVYSTTSGSKTVQLSDGSEVAIAPRSIITLDKDFGRSNRNIKLEGSASFSVKHDNKKPLIVDVNKLYIKDVGTKFTINTSVNADTVYVSVQEGEVLIYDNNRSIGSLIANEKARYVKSLKKLDLYKNDQQSINPGSDSQKKFVEKTVHGNSNRNTAKTDTFLKRSTPPEANNTIGTVLFECSICGEKGNLLFVLLPDSLPSASGFLFDKEAGSPVSRHRERLRPGEYNWYFNNYGELKTEGKVIVKQNEEVKIRLFEK